MHVVTNPGSNLPPRAIEHYGFVISPQTIVAGGRTHDTRNERVTQADVDAWVSTSKEFPHVVGTTAQEYAHIFATLLKEDPEVVAVMTSKKVIQSHAAATSAARTVLERPAFAHAKIGIVDSTFTDIGAGLVALAAGEAVRAQVPFEDTIRTLEKMASRGRLTLSVATLENLVKGGRAGFLRAWLADFFDVKPIIGMVDGELKSVGKMRGKDDQVEAIARDLATIGEGRRVWIGVSHGGDPEKAKRLERRLRDTFDVAYCLVRPLSASIYLHGGRGSLFGVALPIDDLPWTPNVPPAF